MTAAETGEAFYTVSEVADMLGCSVRSLYRWEERGAIPKAQRMERGEVSARVYAKSEVDQIRKLVRERIAFAAIVQERRRLRPPDRPVRVVHVKNRSGITQRIPLDAEWAPRIMKALQYAADHEVTQVEVKITTKDGKVRTF